MTTRRELTFQACDALAAQGIKPAMSNVRHWTYENAGGKRGSDPDVQGDINAWYEALLKLKRGAVSVPGLPDHVASKALDFWLAAQDAALDTIETERAALAVQRIEMAQQLAAKDQQTKAIRATLATLQHGFDVVQETLRGREEMIQRLENTIAQMQAVAAAKDERIEGLTAEMSRKSSDHAAALAELDGLRRHSLMQIDNARVETQHWKGEFDRVAAENRTQVEQYRQRAARAETEAAAARGRLEAVDAELARRIVSESAALLAGAGHAGAPTARGLRARSALSKKPRNVATKSRGR